MNDKQFFEKMHKDFDKTQNGECTSTKGAIVFYAIMIPFLIAILFLA